MKRWMAGLTPQFDNEGGAGSGAAVVEQPAGASTEQKPGEQTSTEQKSDDEKPGEKPGEQKTEEQKAGEQSPAKPKEGEQTPPAKAPEKYDLKVPDGAAVIVTDAVLARIADMGKASNWSNADAQAAVDEYVAQMRSNADRFLTQTKADPDYGGDKLVDSQRLASSVIDRIRPEGHPRRAAFKALLNEVGVGNHIEVLSFLADLGRAMGEDRTTGGRSGVAVSQSANPADKLYDHPTSKQS